MAPSMDSDAKADISSTQVENAAVEPSVTFTAEEEKALVKKIDLCLLPMIWVMYLLSYMDRTKYVTPHSGLHDCTP